MIRKLLIANRGEIAVRIAATAHRLGISTLGVYSEPDANALHVDVMDSAVALGGSTAAESYLRIDAIVAIAVEEGCDAVHPGYGFLAERADAAQAVIDAGLVWVGPSPDQIARLGDKVAAKRLAVEAGVPTTEVIEVAPGAIPADVAMPALVKAAAGGGGRGMRVVHTAGELGPAVEAAAREAAAAFGDGAVFIEPYIASGRHIEVQILGDGFGNVIHLGERECSIQRRNQKVIEEAPSPSIDDATRRLLVDGALALARHVGYTNAGTVEFMVGADGTIAFLEVNTRLQVEHPVTEAVTGLDLVELQLMVAAGHELPVTQDDVSIRGHAIEVRVVAEDPATGWLPSTGVLTSFAVAPGVRVDSGVRAGTTVSSDYDSLLAKVIAHAPTRGAAAGVLARALRASEVSGVRTNVQASIAVLTDADFLAAATPTTYLDDHPQLLQAAVTDPDRLSLLLGAVFALDRTAREADAVTGFAPSGWRNLRTQGQRSTWCSEQRPDDCAQVEFVLTGDRAEVRIGPWPVPVDDGSLSADERSCHRVRLLARADDRHVLEVDGRRLVVGTRVDGDRVHTRSTAGAVTWCRQPTFVVHEPDAGGGGPVCPLPGRVIAVHVAVGDAVDDGDLLMVVEAMKMEHRITATAPSTVSAVHFAEGDRVDTGDLLVSLDAHAGEDAAS